MNVLMLPALSSVSTRAEMLPLAAALGLAATIPDWPGFGARPRGRAALDPEVLRRFLAEQIERLPGPRIGIAAGHAASYLLEQAPSFERLVLIAPTWRGPLPTAFGGGRARTLRRIRRAVEAPVFGALLYRANLSRPVIARMLREHVYADPTHVTPRLVAAKRAVAAHRGGRFGTAAFVTGGLDPVGSHAAFLALVARDDLPPTLLLRPDSAPPRSAAEMDALAATGRVSVKAVPGALLAHEEHAEAVAAAIRDFLSPP